MPTSRSLLAAFRNEAAHSCAQRIPLAVGVFTGAVGLASLLELLLHPSRARLLLYVCAGQILTCVALLVLRPWLLRHGRFLQCNVLAWALLAVLMHGYGIATGMSPELAVIGSLCLMFGVSLIFPWGPLGQTAITFASGGAVLLTIWIHGPSHIPTVYLIFATATGVVISILGARHLELHNLAILREATLREEEVSVSNRLVAIAKEINVALEEPDALDRIARVIRSALDADWSLMTWRDEERAVSVIVGSAGPLPAPMEALRGVEFDESHLPHAAPLLADQSFEADLPERIRRVWNTRFLMARRLRRSDESVGMLIVGRQDSSGDFSDRTRQLFRGIAEHAAIAMTNVQLVSDLRRANNLKSDFLSTMSHELRTPLNVVIGYADLLRDGTFGDLAAEQDETVGRLRDSACSLLELIVATLEVNRIEAGRTGPEIGEVQLTQIITDLQRDTEPLPHKPGVNVRWDVPDQPYVIRTDAMKIKIILKNLIGNALKFTSEGEVAVQITYNPDAARLDANVRDTGKGIDPGDLQRIFEMFQQVKTPEQHGGVGLGLYIVKRYVEQLDGSIEASSRPDEGSTFRLSIPAACVESARRRGQRLHAA